MKTLIKNRIFLMLATACMFSGCKKIIITPPDPLMFVSPIVTSGTWRISSYQQSGSDHTLFFAGYVFNFETDGSLTANKEGAYTNGTWRLNNSNVNEFKLIFGIDDPLKDLGKAWLITSIKSNEFVLQDDNTIHTEEVHFTKI